MKIVRILVVAVLVILLLVLIATKLQKSDETPPTESTALEVGCYIANFEENVYTLEIEEVVDDAVVGKLSYDNAGFDSSSGTFVGTYNDPILLGDYIFEAEGMQSARQVIFRMVESGRLVQGFGSTTLTGNYEQFGDLDDVIFTELPVFNKQACE